MLELLKFFFTILTQFGLAVVSKAIQFKLEFDFTGLVLGDFGVLGFFGDVGLLGDLVTILPFALSIVLVILVISGPSTPFDTTQVKESFRVSFLLLKLSLFAPGDTIFLLPDVGVLFSAKLS